MKRLSVMVILSVIVVALLSVSATAAQSPSTSWIVVSPTGASVSAALSSQVNLAGGRVERLIPQINALVVRSGSKDFAARLRRLGYVVAPNRVIHNYKPERIVKEAAVPNAALGNSNPFFSIQWSLPAIRATEGWVEGRRGAGAVVAVLDEGFYLNHPDLADNFLVAQAASFVPGETVQWTLPEGGFSHGTHVSGIIAALDNKIGTVGVAPAAKIVPVKVLSEQLGYGEDMWVIQGLLYAASLKVDVVNMSLGGVCEASDPECVQLKTLYGLVAKYLNSQGVTVVASAGNDAIDFDAHPELIDLPAMADNILGISATGPLGWALYDVVDPKRPASYSNYGKRIVDFAAPGGDFAYEGEEDCTVGTLTRPCWVFDMVMSPGEASTDGVFYYWAAGTSMAAPHVTGILAQFVGANGGSMSPSFALKALTYASAKLQPTTFYGKGFTLAND